MGRQRQETVKLMVALYEQWLNIGLSGNIRGVLNLLLNLYVLNLSIYHAVLAWMYDQEIGSSKT